MPEIHIVEVLPDAAAIAAAKEAAELAAAITEIGEVATFALWLEEQSDTVQALAQEWASLPGRHPRFLLGSYVSEKTGRTVFVCESRHGYHESYQSVEHALFLMVDAHRTRVEDIESTHQRLRALAAATRSQAFRDEVGRQVVAARDSAARAGRAPTEKQIQDEAELRAARRAALELGARIKRENPSMPGPERDALVLAEIERLEAASDAFVAAEAEAAALPPAARTTEEPA